jgi:succinate dehydrogenase (ubiquinone) membrane anchor subunit
MLRRLTSRTFHVANIRRYTAGPEPSVNTTLAGEKIDPWHGSYHWIYERVLSVASLGLIGAAVSFPSHLVDFAIGVVFPLHCHLGFSSIIIDYLPKRKFPLIYPMAMALLYAGTLGTMYGLYQYNTKDVGICEGMARLWKAKTKNQTEDSE